MNDELTAPIPTLQQDPLFAHGAATSWAKLCSSLHPSRSKECPELKATDGNCWGQNVTCGFVTLFQGHLLFKPPVAPQIRGADQSMLPSISFLALPRLSFAKGIPPKMARDQTGGFCNAPAHRLREEIVSFHRLPGPPRLRLLGYQHRRHPWEMANLHRDKKSPGSCIREGLAVQTDTVTAWKKPSLAAEP